MSATERETNRTRNLLAMGLEPPGMFADYEKLEWIGAGASGDVYRARRAGEDRLVALKEMVRARAASQAEKRRFQNGAAAAAALDHPHIAQVLDFGVHEGTPYVVMALIEGESLKEILGRGLPSLADATRWILTIADAVRHAHEEEVLHRDLKPANIIIDRQGAPHLVDFGLARRLDQESPDSRDEVAGTPRYMAPEQASPRSGPLTVAADVYGLGAVFYEMLTGKVPVGDGAPPTPPRSLNRAISRGLENVCLKCLEKDPARRYSSAAALAEDLKRASSGARTMARPLSAPRRLAGWARRHPRWTAGALASAALGALALALVAASWRGRAIEERRVLDTNAFIASGQAGAILFQLRAYADRVERAARHPAVRELLARGEIVVPSPQLAPLLAGFDSIFLESEDGRLLAQSPEMPHVMGRSFSFRDYFQGARQLAQAGIPGVYVGRAFRSESQGRLNFALAAPVLDDEGDALGVVAVTLDASRAFGAVRIQEEVSGNGRIITALLGPRGNERAAGPAAPQPSDYTFLVHPGLGRGVEYTLRSPDPRQLRAALGAAAPPGQQFTLRYAPPFKVADYRDPIPGFEGHWLAAFAPVGETGFVVLVETPAR